MKNKQWWNVICDFVICDLAWKQNYHINGRRQLLSIKVKLVKIVDYKGISLLIVPVKVYGKVLMERLMKVIEKKV